MNVTAESSILLVPGAWHGAWAFEGVLERLARDGVDARAVDLPSVGSTTDLARDAGVLRDALAQTNCAHGRRGPFLRRDRHERGGSRGHERGRARLPVRLHARRGRVAARRAAAPGAGVDRGRRGGGHLVPVHAGGGVLRRLSARRCRRGRRPHPAPFACVLRRAADGSRVAREVPSAYVICSQDRAIPPAAEEAMSARAGTVERMDTSHSPFLSRPDELVAVLRRTAAAL